MHEDGADRNAAFAESELGFFERRAEKRVGHQRTSGMAARMTRPT